MLIKIPAWTGQRTFPGLLKMSSKPTASTITQWSTKRSCGIVESTHNAEFKATSGQNNLRQNLLAEGISERASNLITNNWRTSSIKSYQSAWKTWRGWCSEWEIIPTRTNINPIADFLAELLENGLIYRIIGTRGSAILGFHDPTGNIWLSNPITLEYLPSCHVYSIRDLPSQSITVFGM